MNAREQMSSRFVKHSSSNRPSPKLRSRLLLLSREGMYPECSRWQHVLCVKSTITPVQRRNVTVFAFLPGCSQSSSPYYPLGQLKSITSPRRVVFHLRSRNQQHTESPLDLAWLNIFHLGVDFKYFFVFSPCFLYPF